jgi:hypothetical protein
MDYAVFEANLLAWLPQQADIRAAAVIGSRGRTTDHPADASADYDLLLVTTEPDSYRQTAWLAALGPLVSAVFDPNDHVAFAQSLDFFTIYAGGNDVDFSLLPYDYVKTLIDNPEARERDFTHLITPTLTRGVRILHDPEGLITQLAAVFPAGGAAFSPPDHQAFQDAVENFWQSFVRIQKKLRVGRLYAAQRWLGGQREDLMRMVEWHARLTRGLPDSTWYRDKYLERWADRRVVAALPGLYAGYSAADIRRALLAAAALFGWVAREAAAPLGHRYPEEVERAILDWAEQEPG